MSDPINVIFHSPSHCEVGPLVYLHWGAPTVFDDLEAALPRLRTGDVPYATARFIGYCHTQLEGINSLGVSNLLFPDIHEGEFYADVYPRIMAALGDDVVRVNVDTWLVEHEGRTRQLPAERAGRADGCYCA
jgi:hypothetical protein